MTEIIAIDTKVFELYHSIACQVLGFSKPSTTLLSEFPAVVEFLSHVREASAGRMSIHSVDAIGSAIPMLSDVEFLVLLIDLVSGCLDETVDSILRVTVINRFIEVSSNGVIWLLLKDRLPTEVLQALKQSLRKIVELSWQGRRVESRRKSVDAAFV